MQVHDDSWQYVADVTPSGELTVTTNPWRTINVAISGIPPINISGTIPDVVSISGTTNVAISGTPYVIASGTSTIAGSMAITTNPVPVSGLVNQGTIPWQTSGTSNVLGSVAITTNPVPVSGIINQGTTPWQTSGTANVLGSVAITALAGGVAVSGPNQNYYYDGTNWQKITTDKSTHSTTNIKYEHHEIHRGRSFSLCGSTLLGINDEFVLGVTTNTGSRWIHAVWDTSTKGEANIEIWEGGTLSGGTVLNPVNRNRNAGIASVHTFAENPTISGASPTSGTRMEYIHLGAAQKVGGLIDRANEWILKSGTSYMFLVRSEVASNHISACLNWYEHTDKTQQF